MKTDNNILLLKTNMGAGHGARPGVTSLKEIAFVVPCPRPIGFSIAAEFSSPAVVPHIPPPQLATAPQFQIPICVDIKRKLNIDLMCIRCGQRRKVRLF